MLSAARSSNSSALSWTALALDEHLVAFGVDAQHAEPAALGECVGHVRASQDCLDPGGELAG